jgi:hypothetical protein
MKTHRRIATVCHDHTMNWNARLNKNRNIQTEAGIASSVPPWYQKGILDVIQKK